MRRGRRQGHQVRDAGAVAVRLHRDRQHDERDPVLAREGRDQIHDQDRAGQLRALADPQCTAGQSICKWQLSFFGTAGSWYFPAFPTGDSLFQSKGGSNFGNYSNPQVDDLISQSTTSSSNDAIQGYSASLARELPVIWLPEPVYQISVIRNGLGGFSQDSLANFHPAQWKWTS
ncbi:hypothetical protein MBT84_43840 [Streptomyces sp. MBT84]|nr:hypothetical protein [Streptomyces sp. MBT84]